MDNGTYYHVRSEVMNKLKLNYFPRRYPDEDFRSIIYRYHLHTGNIRFMQTIRELFGREFKQGIIPRNVEVLIQRLPSNHGWSILNLLNEHSLFPLYRAFLPRERWEIIEKSLNELEDSTNQRRFSDRVNKIAAHVVRYCPRCLKEDFESFGECYLHRLHQIDKLDICHRHHIQLICRCPICNSPLIQDHKLLSTPYCPLGHYIEELKNDGFEFEKIKLSFIEEYEYLFTTTKVFEEDVKRLIQEGLHRNGFINLNGTVLKKKFLDQFLNSIDQGILEYLGISKEDLLERYAYRRLLKPQQFFFAPSIFLLILMFLKISIKKIEKTIETNVTTAPFGEGPWECLNVVCPSYKSKVITTCTTKFRSSINRFVGIFHCDKCGYTYRKTPALDQSKDRDMFRVADRGELWRNHILSLYQAGLSANSISKKMKVNVGLICYHLKRLGATTLESVNKEIAVSLDQVSAGTEITEREENRETLLSLLRQNPNFTRTQLSKINMKTYMWIFKNDQLWLDKVLPRRTPWQFRMLDNHKLDEQLVVKLGFAAQELYHNKIPKHRIYKKTIINQLEKVDQNRLYDKKEKLPKSWRLLNELEESIDDFSFRNLTSAINKLKSSGHKNITFSMVTSRWKLYENCTDRVCLEFERLLIALQDEK